jgi:hypothetical protein
MESTSDLKAESSNDQKSTKLNETPKTLRSKKATSKRMAVMVVAWCWGYRKAVVGE